MQPPSAKSILPRSLFGRALLILLIPMVVLQLVVGLVFFQRHYLRVTDQMARSLALELRYALDVIEAAPDAPAAGVALQAFARPLRLSLQLEPGARVEGEVRREVFDLTGQALVAALEEDLPGPLAIDLVRNPRAVHVALPSARGALRVIAPRSRLTVSNPHQLLVLMLIASLVLGAVAVLFLRNQVRPARRGGGGLRQGPVLALPPRRGGGGAPRRGGLPQHARPDRAADRAAHPGRGQPRPAHAAHPDEAHPRAARRRSRDRGPRPGHRPDGADAGEFLAFARGDVLEESAATDPISSPGASSRTPSGAARRSA